LRKGRISILFAFAAVACLAVPAGGHYMAGMDSAQTTEEAQDAQELLEDAGPRVVVQKQWAVYVYCGADNAFEGVTDFALDQCVKALGDSGSVLKDLHVVALLDRQSEPGTWVYELTESGRQTDGDWADYERNTSHPDTMAEFLDFATSYYPGDKTLLVVKTGHAWCGVCEDVSEDCEKCMMSIHDLASATEDRGIDIIALDGGNMASIEVAYELRHSAKYFVATQQDMPLDGLPYYLFLKDIADVPSMSTEDVAKDIVCDFVLYYNNTQGMKNTLDHQLSDSDMAVTASAFDLGDDGEKIGAVVSAFSDLVTYMVKGELPEALGGALAYDESESSWAWIPSNRSLIACARDAALIGKMGDQAGYEWLPDIYTWLDVLEGLVNNGTLVDGYLRALVDEFQRSFNASFVCLDQSQILNRSGLATPHGLNMWFPPSWTQWDILEYSRTREYYYNGSRIELPPEIFCVECPFFYGDVGLDIVEDCMWMEWFRLYYDSKWTIYGSLEAPRETPLWIY
jgi:hypothetical protein